MKDNIEIAADYTDWMVKTGGFARDMTLRDHFAGLAMQGIIYEGAESSVEVANWAYGMADAMIEERNK
jgi:hypothetical protein